MVILIIISLFLASPLSTIVWQYSPLPQLVQFPWRLLSLTTFALAAWAGGFPKKWGLLLTIAVIAISLPYLSVDRTFHPESYYTTNDDTTTVKNEYMPKWVKINPTNRPTPIQTVYFPGVKVVVDGQEVEPEINDNGIVNTPGKIVFRETPLHLFADTLTVLGVLACAVLLLYRPQSFKNS